MKRLPQVSLGIIFLLCFMMPCFEVNAKKPVLTTGEEVKSAAIKWLKAFLQEEDSRELLKEFKDVKGIITVDLVVYAKGNPSGFPYGPGRIQTVFFADTDIEDHRFTGRFKDLLRDKKFDWKMKKGERVKLSYTFEIH